MKKFIILSFLSTNYLLLTAQPTRIALDFDKGWRFQLGDVNGVENISVNEAFWRVYDLLHDWSGD